MPTGISLLAGGLVVHMPPSARAAIVFGLPGGADQASGDLD
jgi:hypothetical protein